MLQSSLRMLSDIDSINLPLSIQRLIKLGVERINPRKIILFGSRAGENARRSSDFDFAFVMDPEATKAWLRFKLDVLDEPITLRAVDLINWDEASEELKKNIEGKGVTIYDRPKALP